jgi:glycerol-3-phosphate dehydrogenase (NAD(P)+)
VTQTSPEFGSVGASYEQIAIVGAGSWGTALAALLAANGHEIRLWARDPELVQRLLSDRENRQYLPGKMLDPAVHPVNSLGAALSGARVVVFAVPSGAMREVALLCATLVDSSALVISAAKGLEEDTGLRMSQVLEEILPGIGPRQVALSGPNLAVEIAQGAPTASVAASSNMFAAKAVQRLFLGDPHPTFRVYTGSDVTGVEIGGAIKNSIAIGAGILEGLGYGDNSRAALMTRGLAEAVRLGVAEGAQMSTFLGLSGVGDLIVTGGSRLSRNYRVGYALGQGRALDDVLEEIGQVAEGVPTTRALCDLAARCNIEIPLCAALYAILFEGRPIREIIRELMLRPPKDEHDEVVGRRS